jgi:2-amino-4-hydroxy-6-hydroxymethyldihydropteridine diphosphokinase
MTRAYVGFGANMGDREASLEGAIDLLEATPKIHVVALSRFRETDPVGLVDQPRFLNGAVAIDTELPAQELLDRLLAIERELGRERGVGPRWGPRSIDLDLLLYGEETFERPGLRVPHPRLHERRFALEPLADLDPALVVPGRGPVSTLLAGLQ